MRKMTKLTLFLLLFCFSSIHAATIPPKAEQFLKTHFVKYQITKSKSKNDGRSFYVSLKTGHGVEFDKNGSWTKINGEYSPIPKSIIDMLPLSLTKYVSKNYPRKAIICLKRKKGKYIVELANSDKLIFDLKGNFIDKD